MKRCDRLLVIRTLDIAIPDPPTLQPIPMVATIEYPKTDDMHTFTGRAMGMGTQVAIGSRSVEPRFAMRLDLHRQGDFLPTTAWNPKNTRPTVTWPDQQEAYAVEIAAEGHRAFRRLQ